MRIGNHIFYRYADLVAFRDKHFNIENYATSTDAKEGAVKWHKTLCLSMRYPTVPTPIETSFSVNRDKLFK